MWKVESANCYLDDTDYSVEKILTDSVASRNRQSTDGDGLKSRSILLTVGLNSAILYLNTYEKAKMHFLA